MNIVSARLTVKHVPRQPIWQLSWLRQHSWQLSLPRQPSWQLSRLRFLCYHPQQKISFNSKPSILQQCAAPLVNLICVYNYSVELSESIYEQLSDETLESLSDFLEELTSSEHAPGDCDVLYSVGVLTLQLGSSGTYVINKQTPNKQIWLSSPVSGPKRYDFVDGVWIYKHSGVTLHHLLSQELSEIFKTNIDFSGCAYGSSSTN
ncbi:frataxin, mitochondrial [Procambarus clarkii]|uniref:frataxin, mitochondrial n=1 Tax=Procambarus clarkii TaxID=6728 RepID=UPI001E674EB9|nr:frataxin, mitochondrial-like [Procambarus clarkii]XP_045604278.1 frataxin, mitochondrial-like [Procambarus clarkii]XP_045604279.1 frataxin, mitochondrial-like [Procambarus clarkii]XP_045604280.1 frataxin, mitochondrial-like [Procambarus clarkii]XP_045604282.1 frataxin, mitochondrial-like [Procambarus clarkii]